MTATRLPKSRFANTPRSGPVGAAPPMSAAPINAEAHARFGHSFGQVAVTPENVAPIQRQTEKNSCVVGEEDEFGTAALSTPQSLFSGMMTPDGNNASSNPAPPITSQVPSSNPGNEAERQKIQADLQTKIFEVTQDITVNKAKTADKAFHQMDEYIRQ